MGTNAEFNLRFTKKMIEREATLAEKKYDASRKKVADTLRKSGDVETARIYAETAIQHRTSHNQFLIMASRIDAIISKIQQANAQNVMMKNMKQMNKLLEQVNKDLNAGELTKVMDKFEQAFEDLDVKEKVMSDAMNNATATSAPTESVRALLEQIASECDVDIRAQLDAVPEVGTGVRNPQREEQARQDRALADLRRAAQLQN